MKRSILPGLVCAVCLFHFGLYAAAQSSAQPQSTTQPAIPAPTVPSVTPPGIVPPSGAPVNVPNTTKVDDGKFLQEAALNGMTEVELGKLAQEKSSSDAVKQYAQKIIDDHGKTNGQLKQVAEAEKLPVPDALDDKHQARIDKLSKLSGAAFDKAYINDERKNHELAVKHFDAEAHDGSRANVMAFALTAEPTLKQHCEMSKALKKSEKRKK